MITCGALDVLVGLVVTLAQFIVTTVNAAWSAIDFAGLQNCMAWFGRLDCWLPVSEFFTFVGIAGALAALTLIIKFGIKAVDWIRG